MRDLVGETLAGRYRILERIVPSDLSAANALFQVYKAADERDFRHVTLKRLRDDLAADTAFLRRFRRLVGLLRTLEHPNIVRCYGLEQTRDHVFILTEHVRGMTLDELLRRIGGRLSQGQALLVLQAVAAALRYAHEQGIYHTDLQPSNVILQQGGQVLVQDFGLAHWTSTLSRSPSGFGNPIYMSPEQLAGAEVDQRTDVYALGVLAHVLLTGSPPLQGETGTHLDLVDQHIRRAHADVPLSSVSEQLLPEMEAAILRALSKDPARRPRTVQAFLREIAGEELAALYPPSAELAEVLGPLLSPEESPSDAGDLRRAALRLVAFFSGGREPLEKETESAVVVEEAAKPPCPAEPPTAIALRPSAEAAGESGKLRYTLTWSQLRATAERAGLLLMKAGAKMVQGDYEEVQALCADILAQSPEHLAARILAAEAKLARLYAQAREATESGEKGRAIALLQQILAEDTHHRAARALLAELQAMPGA